MPETDTIPVSASIASTGLGIRYIGDYAYAYSGTFQAATSAATMLSFTTGSGFIVGEFTFNAQTRIAAAVSGGTSAFEVQFNDLVVSLAKVDSAAHDMPTQAFQKVIIPPFTKVQVQMISTEDTANELITVTFTGRVYGEE